MIKKPIFILLMLFIFIPTISMASVIQLSDGAYDVTAVDVIATQNIAGVIYSGGTTGYRLGGPYFYIWTLDDADLGYTPTAINVVFHHIQDNGLEKNDSITLFLKDLAAYTTPGFVPLTDNSGSTNNARLNSYLATGFVELDSWSDPYPEDIGTLSYYDVVFTITDPTYINWITDGAGDQFQFLINPECYYEVAQITIDAVPIPPAVLLLGSGVFGLLMIKRRKRM